MAAPNNVNKEFDLIVIGGGSGGLACARRAASYGQRVALIEDSRLGGTCVNVGCVPKKVMFNTSMMNEMIHDAPAYGFEWPAGTPHPSFNWASLKSKRDAYVARLNGIYANNLKNDKVTHIQGHGSFVAARTVRVNGQDYEAPHILVATGGYPLMGDVKGVEHAISSDGFFDLPEQPKRVAVVGAGYIAVELAGIFNALGSDTHLFVRHDRPLRKFDHTLIDALVEEMRKSGLNLHAHVGLEEIIKDASKQQGPLSIRFHQAESEAKDAKKETKTLDGFDCVLLAIGRGPRTAGLGLEAAGIDVVKGGPGHIRVDAFQNTSAPGVYALGDVCGKVELTPVAIAAGRQLAERLFNNQQHARLDYDNVPTVVFSHPPLGTVGLTEREAVERYGRDHIKIYTSKFTNMFFAMITDVSRRQATLMKLIVAGEEEKVVGVHLLGMAADEILQGFGVAVKMGATKKQLDSCVAIHPTAAEELVTMRGATKPTV